MDGLKVTTNFHNNRIKVTIIQNILDHILQPTIKLTHMITRSSNVIVGASKSLDKKNSIVICVTQM